MWGNAIRSKNVLPVHGDLSAAFEGIAPVNAGISVPHSSLQAAPLFMSTQRDISSSIVQKFFV